MKTLLTLIGLSVALGAAAADTAVLVPAPVPKAAPPSPFSKGEFLTESFYTARYSGSFNDPAQSFGVGVGYAITPNIVAAGRLVSYTATPNLIDDVVGRVAYRAQLSWLPKGVFPYAFTEGGGNIHDGVGFAGAGGGLEWRPFKHVRLGAEADVRENTEWQASIGFTGFLGISF